MTDRSCLKTCPRIIEKRETGYRNTTHVTYKISEVSPSFLEVWVPYYSKGHGFSIGIELF